MSDEPASTYDAEAWDAAESAQVSVRNARLAALQEAADICSKRAQQYRSIGHTDKISAAVGCRLDIDIRIAEIKAGEH